MCVEVGGGENSESVGQCFIECPPATLFQLAEQLYQTMTKRFSTSLRVWVQYGHFLMRRGKQEAARSLLQRSLKSLSNKQQRERNSQK